MRKVKKNGIKLNPFHAYTIYTILSDERNSIKMQIRSQKVLDVKFSYTALVIVYIYIL